MSTETAPPSEPPPAPIAPEPSREHLRGYFANTAMQELIRHFGKDLIDSNWIADTAYVIADAMMKRKDQKDGN
jgi:hypothetical protein